jgi:multiple sugar transport system permease protein
MDMMGRGFGALKFGQAAAYGFILTAVIVLFTGVMFAFGKRRFAQ